MSRGSEAHEKCLYQHLIRLLQIDLSFCIHKCCDNVAIRALGTYQEISKCCPYSAIGLQSMGSVSGV